ncbi:uncharacterized protein LOC112568746 isoform X2 [Pomacea canaliculata]|uniref:uncharacterized protein LOC112568746 isoform X2 n=1 Tax=Pomacea canaliculata TaxID=400727 RepID=UPI000D727058|nr:uncharacterized protein LOC112568746 isoform X2 [Pomacea canaliculata]
MEKCVVLLAFLLPTFLAQGNENECKVYTSENCIQEVQCKIKDESVEKRRSFTLYLISSTGEEETVAQMSYVVGYYKCETARNYTCGKENDSNFLITLPCTARGELKLSDDEKAIPCMRAQRQRSSSELNKSIYKKNDTNFQNDTSMISEENKHMTKTVIAVSVCLTMMILSIGICCYKRKVIFKAFRKMRKKEVKKDGHDAEIALNPNNTVNQTTTPDKILWEQE